MLRKSVALLLLFALLLSGCAMETGSADNRRVIIATIYPVYLAAINVARDVPGVEIRQLLPMNAGCGHDYQLTTEDVRAVEGAELLLSHGLELEAYLANLREAYPDLPMLATAKNVEVIAEEHGDQAHANPHTWLDPQAAITQAQEISRYLASVDEANASAYNANCEAYVAKLEALDLEIEETLAPIENRKAISYHSAFAYFARRYGFTIAEEIAHSEDEQPSSQQIAHIIDAVRAQNIPAVWLEDEGERTAVQAIVDETGLKPLVLSAVTSGEAGDPDAYINAQRENARILAEALS